MEPADIRRIASDCTARAFRRFAEAMHIDNPLRETAEYVAREFAVADDLPAEEAADITEPEQARQFEEDAEQLLAKTDVLAVLCKNCTAGHVFCVRGTTARARVLGQDGCETGDNPIGCSCGDKREKPAPDSATGTDAEPIEVGQVWTPWAQGASPRSYVVKWISGENVYMEPLVPLYTPCGFEEASRWTRCEIRNGWRRLPFERTRPKE